MVTGLNSNREMAPDTAEIERAPYLAGAGFVALLAGAVFLAFSASQTPTGATSTQIAAATEYEPPSAALDDLSATSAAPATMPVNTADDLQIVETRGVAPRLSRHAIDAMPDVALVVATRGVPPTLNPTRDATPLVRVRGVAPSLNPNRSDADANSSEERGFAPRLNPRRHTSLQDATPGEPFIDVARAKPMLAPVEVVAERSETDEAQKLSFAQATRASVHLVSSLTKDLATDLETTTVALSKGETFVDALKRAKVAADDRNAAAYAFGQHHNLRRLRPGQQFELTIAQPNQTIFQSLVASTDENDARLMALSFRADPENRIEISRTGNGALTAEKTPVPLTTELKYIHGHIEGSLFVSAQQQGAPNKIIGNLANIFAYDIDFQRDIFGGDEFEAVFEVKYDDDGELVSAGDILFAKLNWRGRRKEKGYYLFASRDGGTKADYYDAAGQSAKRLLMKTPIDGARLSSGFGTRRHPILGYRKAHKGVDFAAPRGTPIYAAGDGVVERANRYGSFGNYVRIRHANGYKTAYAHLKGFARGMRAGKRVDQGDVIGYVGTTGRSTGPHLHYEVHFKGKAINPQKLKIATGVSLKGAELDRFRKARDLIDAMRPQPEEIEAAKLLVQKTESSGEDSL